MTWPVAANADAVPITSAVSSGRETTPHRPSEGLAMDSAYTRAGAPITYKSGENGMNV